MEASWTISKKQIYRRIAWVFKTNQFLIIETVDLRRLTLEKLFK